MSFKESLSWVRMIINAKNGFRKSVRRKVLKHFLEEADNENNGYDPKTIKDIYDGITSSDFEYVGLMPNVAYIKENAEGADAEAIWVHPFGYPTLLYKHKSSPMFVIVNPLLRLNSSVVMEVPLNKYETFLQSGVKVKRPGKEDEAEGITG